MPYFKIIILYLIFINILSLLFCIYDKLASKRGLPRIRESALLWLCVLGGSVVMLGAMKLIRHKTRHKKFMVGIPIIILLQIAVAIFLIFGIDKSL